MMLVEGYERAVQQLVDAGQDPDLTFYALFEALNWATGPGSPSAASSALSLWTEFDVGRAAGARDRDGCIRRRVGSVPCSTANGRAAVRRDRGG
jgi:hypothetical protein